MIISSYDAVFVQRGLYAMGPGSVVRVLERYRGRVVFDLDDAMLLGTPALARRSRLAQWLYGPQQAIRLLRRADAVIVSTEALAVQVSRHRAVDAILPTVPDTRGYPLAKPGTQTAPVVLGWVGSVRNVDYLDPLRAVIDRLTRDGLVELVVVSARPWDGPSRFVEWTLAQEASVFGGFAIGLMPLPDTPYTRAKAGFKLLQYMAAGVPFVASPVGVNRYLAEESRAGLLAESPEAWKSAIRTLAVNPALRAELGSRGRRFVRRYADLELQADTIARMLAP
jgi:glycosyltransferase involved in cell wall biosynthesis